MTEGEREVQQPIELDRTIHEPARLLILTHLSALETVDFLYLLRHTQLTRGNLSSHMRKLEDAGYVEVEKTFVDRLPLTLYRLTDDGREALVSYREQMGKMLDALAVNP